MNTVQAIRDPKKITQIKNLLRGERRFRDLLFFTVGINAALRVSDLLQLQVHHFLDDAAQLRLRSELKESKGGKRQELIINESIAGALTEYRAAYPLVETDPNHFLFFSTRSHDYSKPISREQGWHIISKVCQAVGLKGHYGTHTLRKTWGYHARMNGVELSLIMHKLNHNDLAYTQRYLGITDEELEVVIRRLNL